MTGGTVIPNGITSTLPASTPYDNTESAAQFECNDDSARRLVDAALERHHRRKRDGVKRVGLRPGIR
jgi:hypothetical protein